MKSKNIIVILLSVCIVLLLTILIIISIPKEHKEEDNITTTTTTTSNIITTNDITTENITTKRVTNSTTKSNVTEKTTYIVTFNSNGGTNVENQTIEQNKNVKVPIEPKRDGYIFEGWYLNDNKYNFNTTVTKDITLTAKWNEILTEKTIDVTENIEYSIKKINEKNMLRDTTSIVEERVYGKKTVTYKVLYNSKGEEISKTKLTEKIISNPKEEIIRVGISDYNLNTDTYDWGMASFCLDEDRLVVDGIKVAACNKIGIDIEYVDIKNKSYYYLSNGGSYINLSNSYIDITNDIKIIEDFTIINYKGVIYYSVGGAGGGLPIPLTEKDCERFKFACGRW